MSDPIPDRQQRLATLLGYLFHPFVLFVPSALLVLRGQSLGSALAWIALMGTLTILPTAALIVALQRRGQYLYQREVRWPVYRLAWLATLVCGLVLWQLEAPQRLLICTAAILLWIPLQAAINEAYTKISGHAAFSLGVMLGLAWLGELPTLGWQIGALAVVLLTAWARYVSKHHTLEQILLGWLVAGLSVSLSFALLL